MGQMFTARGPSPFERASDSEGRRITGPRDELTYRVWIQVARHGTTFFVTISHRVTHHAAQASRAENRCAQAIPLPRSKARLAGPLRESDGGRGQVVPR